MAVFLERSNNNAGVRPRRLGFVAGCATMVVVVVVVVLSANAWTRRGADERASTIAERRRRASTADDGRRPVMRTFYGRLRNDDRNTGMNDVADRRLLEEWHASWRAAGWDTKVLTMSDVVSHPDFEEFDRTLNENVDNAYDRLCFLRWLAMSSVEGGGWMSDYDVIPLPTERRQDTVLPHDGRLTVYEYTLDGGVPSLVSGSAEEWYRVARLLLRKSTDPDVGSDMFALIWYHHNEPGSYKVVNKVIKGHVPLSGRITGKKMCSAFKGNIAIHFSHAAIRAGVTKGLLDKNIGPESRAQVSTEWIKNWINLCGVLE